MISGVFYAFRILPVDNLCYIKGLLDATYLTNFLDATYLKEAECIEDSAGAWHRLETSQWDFSPDPSVLL